MEWGTLGMTGPPHQGWQFGISTSLSDYVICGWSLSVKCTETGEFEVPDTWPTCRIPVSCDDTLPIPPDDTNLQESTSTVSNEFDVATYECQSGKY